ncbi:hypothetical protein PHYC_02088 [Phycisphaerales bacterium]|nr:hypothetical protein PHYC_02088 [Phycisphaerales bacterium]
MNESPRKSGQSRMGLSGVLRTLAGAPAAWRAKRRGSFLVLVVGTLALLSVFAILYVSIGNQDLRTRGSLIRREALDDVPEQMARYIADDIIARDARARWYPNDVPDPADARFPMGWREATDYPSINWAQRSNGLTSATFFDPTGTMDRPEEYRFGPTGNFPARWLPTDPWLAALEPTWLNYDGLGLNSGETFYNRNRDWAQISNIAPDGRFVNLWNLKNNFDALPGVGLDPRGLPRLSMDLSLFGADGRTTNDADFHVAADPQIPAFWTARQQGAFRPVDYANGNDQDPSRRTWPQYQWADADGDGMLDSRWFALMDWREGTPGQPGGDVVDLLDTDGSIRYFFAARIVDLSGLINVNTAGDFLADPDWASPAGISGGDIDLRRLLTLRDRVNDDLGIAPAPPQGTAYDGLYGSPNSTPPEQYGPVNGPNAYEPIRAHNIGVHSYTALRLGLESRAAVPADDVTGRYLASDGLYDGGYESDLGVRPIPYIGQPAAGTSFIEQFRTIPAARAVTFDRFTSSGVSNGMFTGNFLGSYVDRSAPSMLTISGAFGLLDLSELLTFRATNDLSATSNLEAVLGGGRDDSGPPGPGTPSVTRRLSVMRINRAMDSEGHRDFDSPLATSRTLLHFAADVRQRLTTLSGGREFRNARGVSQDEILTSELKIDAGRAISGGNGSLLFRGYVRALAGEAKTGMWNTEASAGRTPEQTLFYGYNGAELAVHVAGHMAANAADAFDAGSSPRAFTLVTDRSFGTTIEAADRAANPDMQIFPAAHVQSTRMDVSEALGAGSIADAAGTGGGDTPIAPAVNIFGVEAQPFITQVTTFTVYTDAPGSVPGAVDEDPGTEVTIDGKIDPANADFLYRVVAFQITNPFGVDITLPSNPTGDAQFFNVLHPQFPAIDREDGFYYIEFGGKYFKLARLQEEVYIDAATATQDEANNVPSLGDDNKIGEYVPGTAGAEPITLHPISIPAGRTISVYTISQVPRRILSDRILRVDVALDGQSGQPSPRNMRSTIHRAIEHNLRAGTDMAGAYWIPEFTPADGKIHLPASGADEDPLPSGATVANLYRAVRLGSSTIAGEGHRMNVSVPGTYWDLTTGPTNNTPEMYDQVNRRENDRLMDRMRIVGDLNRKIPDGDQEVNGTDVDEDDLGYTIALWANVHRPRDPGTGGTPNIPVGAFPAYCLEPKYFAGWNVAVTDPANPSSLQRTDFSGNDGGEYTVPGWRSFMYNNAIATLPSHVAPNNFPASMPKVGTAPRNNPAIPDTANYQQHYAEIVLPNGSSSGANATATAFRLGDLLLPLGIGPCEKPLRMDLTLETDLRLRWTTLGEAMASALGYEVAIPAGVVAEEAMSLFTPRPDPAGSGVALTVLDRGGLKLDAYAPFLDVNTDGMFSPPPTGTDERRGLELPPAMAIFDEFSVQMPFDQTVATDVLERASRPSRLGIVNINTAPLAVARCLPMLSPPPATDPAAVQWWWWSAANGLKETSDVAATAIAYRDKKDERLRPQSASNGPSTGVVTFADLDQAGAQPIPPNQPYDLLNGRSYWSSIPGLNENPGFRSVGELLAVQFNDGAASALQYSSNMKYLGNDLDASSVPQNNPKKGVTPVQYSTGGGPAFDTLANEYKEQLTVFQGVANTVTTRSDIYACWFVVHGYKKSDVENLKPEDPVVPSVKRRFLMVVDRSKVVKRGDKAEILLMKEVPYQPQ